LTRTSQSDQFQVERILKNADTVNKTEIGTLGTMLTLTKHRRGTAVVEVDPRKPFTIYG